MPVLEPVSTTEIVPRRPTEDEHGNKSFTALPAVSVVVSLTAEKVFVPRGTGLLPGDEFTYNGWTYFIDSRADGDQDQPFTGDDFGWVGHKIQAAQRVK